MLPSNKAPGTDHSLGKECTSRPVILVVSRAPLLRGGEARPRLPAAQNRQDIATARGTGRAPGGRHTTHDKGPTAAAGLRASAHRHRHTKHASHRTSKPRMRGRARSSQSTDTPLEDPQATESQREPRAASGVCGVCGRGCWRAAAGGAVLLGCCGRTRHAHRALPLCSAGAVAAALEGGGRRTPRTAEGVAAAPRALRPGLRQPGRREHGRGLRRAREEWQVCGLARSGVVRRVEGGHGLIGLARARAGPGEPGRVWESAV